MHRYLLPLTLSLLVISCAADKPPIIKTEDKIVKVPVSVPCKVELPSEPVYPLDTAKESEDLFSKVKKALAELEIRRAYETKLKAAAKSCS